MIKEMQHNISDGGGNRDGSHNGESGIAQGKFSYPPFSYHQSVGIFLGKKMEGRKVFQTE
jgi:hypothetical protein